MALWRLASMITVAFAAGLTAARADAIDGDWCDGNGRRIHIEGPRVLTPGGATISGQYGRHDFSYVVPANEPQAGGTMALRLVNSRTVMAAEPGGASSTWLRCTPVS